MTIGTRALAGALLSLSCALVLVAASACSSSTASPDEPTCPNDLPTSCPSPEPSYANDVVPVLTRACKVCHTPGGRNSDQLFDTFTQVHAQRTEILTQVNSCRMPLPDAGPLSTADRQVLLGWLVCGANDN